MRCLEKQIKVRLPRILIGAGKSGVGKTMITCGILAALKQRGLKVTAYKCGPDYIDPMFHREILGIPSYNLDTFLCGKKNMPEILLWHSAQEQTAMKEQAETKEQIAVIEGVMGYYDGLGGVSCEASTYDVADTTDTPVILIVDCKGASVSVVPYIQGFLKYQGGKSENSHIEGVILNRISPMLYERMKGLIEKETSARVFGYVPEIRDFTLESRYLGLKLPGEMKELREKLMRLGNILEDSLDIDGLIELTALAKPLKSAKEQAHGQEGYQSKKRVPFAVKKESCGNWQPVRIGVAMDEAFCFIYPDNLYILEEMGAKIVPFSPLHDEKLPEGLSGVIFYGGYPELYAGELSRNQNMREQVRQAVLKGLPCIAECGGFMYLTESIRDEAGELWPMCGVFGGESYYTPKLQRFGYVILCGGKVFGKEAGEIYAHEFHYYDSEKCGEAFEAAKPLSERSWRCMISTDSVFAGYPHIHYAGSPRVAEGFIEACRNYCRGEGKDVCKERGTIKGTAHEY